MKISKRARKGSERGAALAMAVIIIAILSVIALTALAFSSTEARIAGSDLQRTRTFYATVSAIEKMTNDFSGLFRSKMRPTVADLEKIAAAPPDALIKEGFKFEQRLEEDAEKLQELQAMQKLSSNVYPRVNIPEGPFVGLYANLIPYKITSTGTFSRTSAQVKLEREFNNYLIPLFQFGIFSNEDIEFHPGPWMTFNGRIHSNQNIYALRNVKFLNRMTMAGELIRDATRGGETNNASGWNNVWIEANGKNVQITKGSVQAGNTLVGGPNLSGSKPGTRGYYPTSPSGVANSTWESSSVKTATGAVNQFGGQILTNSTGAKQLKMPLELEGNSPVELIKRSLLSDSEMLGASRYHNKAKIRVLIDDETAGSGTSNVAGIPAGKGVNLSSFTPIELDGGNALRTVSDAGAYTSDTIKQYTPDNKIENAHTVRGIRKATSQKTADGSYVPPGAGVRGRILIEIVKPDGTAVDVTKELLSMGMTVGEPNGIFYLQRPLWAAFVQGSRDRSGKSFDLVTLTREGKQIADGEIVDPAANPSFFNADGFLSRTLSESSDDDAIANNGNVGPGSTAGNAYALNTCTTLSNGQKSCAPARETIPSGTYNRIVPINVYNVREGWFQSEMDENRIYERGVTSVIELNMRNLVRWVDGVYDANLFKNTAAVSANIEGGEGYVVYISDRRGDRVKAEYLKDGSSYSSSNGTVDNEDIYGPNGKFDDGEDAIDYGWDSAQGAKSKKGTLQKDVKELPDYGKIWGAVASGSSRYPRALEVMGWEDLSTLGSGSYFRRAVRLFDGERLSLTGGSGKLSLTKGMTIASENMVYIWGNYNTTGITSIPAGGSTLNDGGFTGPQVPASIVCDAFFPLSKTWFDGLSALYPEGASGARSLSGTPFRMADDNLPSVSQGTSVRAGIIAGTTISGLTQKPGRDSDGLRRNGGIINYPRFLEIWNYGGTTRSWNYTGSFVPLFRSTQALSQWENETAVIYMPPQRNWSFDQTFLNSAQLPPGTPFFQHIQSTGFRQKIRD